MTRLLLLTAHPQLATPRRLEEECRKEGFRVEFVHPDSSALHPVCERNSAPPWILPRAGPFHLRRVLVAMRRLQGRGASPILSRRSLWRTADQWLTLQALRAAGLAVPQSRLVRRPGDIDPLPPGPPWFVKGRLGSQGTHVLLATDRPDLVAKVARLWGTGGAPILQEDLRPRGPVVRCLVLGDEVLVGAVSRPRRGESRSNWHRGGRFRVLARVPERLATPARRAVRAMGLPWGAVDGMADGTLLEVNASPGLEGLERASGRNLAGEFARFLRCTATTPLPSCAAPPPTASPENTT